MALYEQIAEEIGSTPTPLGKIYSKFEDFPKESVRARIYEHLGDVFERLDRGVYIAKVNGATCTIIKGDAWQELKRIKDNVVDLILTDFAYPWLRHHAETGTTRKIGGKTYEMRDLDEEILSEFKRILKDGAHCFLFVPFIGEDTLDPLIRLINRARTAGLKFHKYFVWNKKVIGMGYTGRAKYGGLLFFTSGRKRMPIDRSIPDLLSVKRVPPAKRKHEDEKPIPLLKQVIKFSTRSNELVVDPFAGSGNTGVAALELDRSCILIEIKRKFVEKIIIPNVSRAASSRQQTLVGN